MNILLRKCPHCGGSLRHPNHPHAFGYKETGIVVCRRKKTCGKRFDACKLRAWYEKKDANERAADDK